jgi:hypothetical protein
MFFSTIVHGFVAVVFVRHVWMSAARRRWWALGAVVAIYVLMLIQVLRGFAPEGIGPLERLQWDHWYLIPLWPVYSTGLLIVAWKLVQAFVMVVLRGIRGLARRVRPKRSLGSALEAVTP